MVNNEISQSRKRIETLILKHRLHDAFKELKNLCDSSMAWELSEELGRIEQSYRFMLKYAVDGVNDPHREEMYADLIANLYKLLDQIIRFRSIPDAFSLYYNTLRYNQKMLHATTIEQQIDLYAQKCDSASIFNLIIEQSGESAPDTAIIRTQKEELERQIFNHIWIAMPLSASDIVAINSAMTSQLLPIHFKELILSAVIMGQLEFYDENRLRILLDTYTIADDHISTRALIGIILSFALYPMRITGKKILSHIASVKEATSWSSDVKMAVMEFIRSYDTERVNRKMQDELIPEMLKLRPDINKKINDSMSIIDMSSIEENPEWEELLQNSGLTDKLKELSELQEEGSDVFMSTFAQLKSYPFFSEISNWFLPFHLDHSVVVNSLGNNLTAVGQIIERAPFLCNGDKYSFVLSLSAVPEAGKQMMISQFESQMQAATEAGVSISMLSQGNFSRRNLINKNIQDLYRFFKLFRRKGEFKDPFKLVTDIFGNSLLADDLADVETMSLAAQFYFKRKYYTLAFEIFESIADKTLPDAQLYQKMGYCCQQNQNMEQALTFYLQSELLNANSIWTLRRIAACYRLLNQPQKALEYYERVVALAPNDLNIVLSYGHTLLDLNRFDEAIKQYYKVEFLDEKSTRAWRPLAWSLLLSRDFEQSRRYYDLILNDNPTAEDYLNMGHLALATTDYHKAINYYGRSLVAGGGDVESLSKALNDDIESLKLIGVQLEILPLIIDSVQYHLDK